MKLNYANSHLLHQQELLARANRAEATKVVLDFHSDLEKKLGVPIEIQTVSGMSRGEAYWNSRRIVEHHIVYIDENSKEWLVPKRLAAGMVQIVLEAEANEAGRRMTRCCWGAELKRRLPPLPERRTGDVELLQELFHLTGNVVGGMVVETRLHKHWPVLRPAQFLSFHQTSKADIALKLPSDRYSCKLTEAVMGICAARALFHDRLNQGATAYFEHFRNLTAGRMGARICDTVQAAVGNLGPGGHYAVIDCVSNLIGFPGLSSWDPRPAYELSEPFEGQVMEID